MDSALISVIIPVYNVEQYLDRCVQSVIHQTLNELEILLVDDGSPDSCPELCDAYAAQDSRIRVIHKPNGGLASARNAGLRAASGSYVFFLDSDDWLDADGLQFLYETAVKHDVDFVRYKPIRSFWPGWPEHAPGTVEEIREFPGGFYDQKKIREVIYPRLIATNQLTMGAIVAACHSLYRTAFLKAHNLFFDEPVKYSEDMIFSAKVVLNARSFYHIEASGIYHYFYNPASISRSFRAGRWESCKKLIQLFEQEFSDHPGYDFTQQLLYLRWFCIMLGLNERKQIPDTKARRDYCRTILNDEIVRSTRLPFRMFDVSWKQKLMMAFIKSRAAFLLAHL